MPTPVLSIGTEKITGDPVLLDLDNTNIIIVGIAGTGKTTLAQLIATDPAVAGIQKTVIDTFNQWNPHTLKNRKLTVHQGPTEALPLDTAQAASIAQRAWHTALERSAIPELSQSILILDPYQPLPGMPQTEDQALHALKTAKQYQFQSITILERLQDLDQDSPTELSALIAKKSKIFVFNHSPHDLKQTAEALQLTPYESLSITKFHVGDCLYIGEPGVAPRWVAINAPRIANKVRKDT